MHTGGIQKAVSFVHEGTGMRWGPSLRALFVKEGEQDMLRQDGKKDDKRLMRRSMLNVDAIFRIQCTNR